MAGSRPGPSIHVPQPGVHLPTLDGVRGLAILLVMLHHFTIYGRMEPTGIVDRLFYRVAYAGWSGVDLFFVLSGFLITGILLETKGGEGFFRNFYIRRILRIFPLYYACLVFFFGVLPNIVSVEPDYRVLLGEQGWYWSYLSNIPIALQDNWPAYYAIAHFWSLAVEEQFYLFWPVVVFLFRRRALTAVCLTLIAGSLLFRTGVGLKGYELAAYVTTPARMDALALGAFLALIVRGPHSRLNLSRSAWLVAAASALALTAIFVWKRALDPSSFPVYTIGFSLLALLSGAIIIFALSFPPQSGFGTFFANPVLGFFGRYSYALYVFHHPVAIYLPRLGFSVQSFPPLLGSQLPGLIAFSLVAGLISTAFALVSWYLVESRFLAFKRHFGGHRNRSLDVPRPQSVSEAP